MLETMLTVVGNVVDEPQIRRTEKGVDVANFRIASTARRFNKELKEWIDGESLFLRVTCWRQLAVNVAASLRQGDPVFVHGQFFTRQYEKDGQKRTSYEVEATAVGPDLSKGTADFRRIRSVPTYEVADDAIDLAGLLPSGAPSETGAPADEKPVRTLAAVG